MPEADLGMFSLFGQTGAPTKRGPTRGPENFCVMLITLSLCMSCEFSRAVQSIQVAQLSQRDRAAGWVSYGQKWKTGTERQYLRSISVYIQPMRRIWSAKKSKSPKKRQIRAITPFKVIHGH